MARVLGIASPKGGVGKTTTAVTLAHLATLAGYSVLLVDADEIGSAWDWSARSPAMTFEVQPFDETEDLAELLVNAGRARQDLVVVDLPGARTSLAFGRLLGRRDDGRLALDALVIPTKVEVMDVRPVARVIEAVVKPSGVPYLLVGTMVDQRSRGRVDRDLDDLRADGIAVARTVIRQLGAHPDAVAASVPITDLVGGRRSAARQAEAEYRALAREVVPPLLGMAWPDDPAPEPADPDADEEAP